MSAPRAVRLTLAAAAAAALAFPTAGLAASQTDVAGPPPALLAGTPLAAQDTPFAPAPARYPAGTTWSEVWLTTPDGERLHGDVLLPPGHKAGDKVPVVLVVSPYLGRESRSAPRGPSTRFDDMVQGTALLQRGYAYAQVSTRGTGGSSGCLDILGPGEQTDVVTAVRWAATAPWSTGKVGMYGKSYDANLGTAGAALQPPGLAAVVAQQVVPDRYRGSYLDRVRYAQSLLYPSATYGASAEGGVSTNDAPEYLVNSASRSADCQALLAEHYSDDESSPFWRVRDFAEQAKGSTVPVFMTTGYLDNATNIGGGAVDFWQGLAGPKRMWIGWWAHERGNDLVGGRLAMGRPGFFAEVTRFYDEHLRGMKPEERDPVVVAQTSDGTWRESRDWPPAGRPLTAGLLSGTYVDDASNRGSRVSGAGGFGVGTATRYGHGAWTFSPPLAERAQLSGTPTVAVDVTPLVPRTNVVVNVYDVSPAGRATMITRGAGTVDAAGRESVSLYPTDWVFEPGHRVGVLVSGANTEAFVHTPTGTTVTVRGGTLTLPWLKEPAGATTDGDSNPRLETFRSSAPFDVPAATVAARTAADFPLPR